jgi:hypothetical protein
MLLAGALLALFMTGCWLYCLTDAILTPAPEARGLSKSAWVAVIAVTFIVGAFAWLIVRRPAGDQSRLPVPQPGCLPDEGPGWTDADDAAARHPASRWTVSGRPGLAKGPDDDPDFLRVLAAAIRRNPPVS